MLPYTSSESFCVLAEMTVALMEDYCVLLFIAGLDTVINGMGFAVRHLAMNPELQARLRAQPELSPRRRRKCCAATASPCRSAKAG